MGTKWKKHGRYLVADRPAAPGVWRCKQGGYFVRARVTDPRTGREREIGRRLQVSDKHAAKAWLEEEKRRIRDGGTLVAPMRLHFSEYGASLLERKVAAGDLNSHKTQVTWATTLEKHLFPVFGDYFMDAIVRQDIEGWKFQVAGKIKAGEYSPHSANVWFRILRVIFNTATTELELPRNPIAGVTPFGTKGHRTYTVEEPNALRPEDVPRFLTATSALFPQHFAMTSLGFSTGLRPSHMRPLRRQGRTPEVLWDRGVVLVRRSQTIGEATETTKTDTDQWLYLPDDLMDVLRWHVERLPPGPMQDSDLLFPSRVGGYRAPSVLDKPFARIAKEIGLAYKVTPQGMRRTFQDLARAANVSDLVARAISGHATETMQRHYSTVREGEMRSGLARVIDLAEVRNALK